MSTTRVTGPLGPISASLLPDSPKLLTETVEPAATAPHDLTVTGSAQPVGPEPRLGNAALEPTVHALVTAALDTVVIAALPPDLQQEIFSALNALVETDPHLAGLAAQLNR